MAIARVGQTEGTTSGGTITTHTGAVTRSCTAGNSLLVIIRWYNAVTVSSIACSGETITLVGSAQGNGALNASARTQFAVINNISSTASKTIDVTYSGAAANSTVSCVEFSGANTSGIAGAHPAAATGTASTNPSHSVTTTAADSLIVGALMSSASGATVGAGYTTLGFGSFWSFEFGECSTATTGATGAKTVDWTNGAADWHIDAIEILAFGTLAEQEGARFGNDDGAEAAHTWAAAQDANITAPAGQTQVLNMIVNATGTLGAKTFKLQYRKVGDGAWRDVPVQ